MMPITGAARTLILPFLDHSTDSCVDAPPENPAVIWTLQEFHSSIGTFPEEFQGQVLDRVRHSRQPGRRLDTLSGSGTNDLKILKI